MGDAIWRNLTPHDVTFVTVAGEVTLPPDGVVARVSTHTDPVGWQVVQGLLVPVLAMQHGDIKGLPDEEENTYLIVSQFVARFAPWRPDVYCPGPTFKQHGVIQGSRGLVLASTFATNPINVR
jgi:hypothetical protein